MTVRLLASPDLYGEEEREPEQSINFVTCHDGFTLNDLVSYDRKHNEANGHGGRDGSDDNLSWNCGVEGPTDDPTIERLRNQQVKNLLAITLLSLGTPMLSMGDEVRRSQGGNNNAYCQDNEISWFDWRLLEKHSDIHRFVKQLIYYRLRRHTPEQHALTLNQLLRQAQVQWHGVKLNQPDWGYDSHSLALSLRSFRGRLIFHFMMNAYWEPLDFELPPVGAYEDDGFGSSDRGKGNGVWRRWIDTALDSPEDICSWNDAPAVQGPTYRVQPRSIAVLVVHAPA
jgi:glycogen operon protein